MNDYYRNTQFKFDLSDDRQFAQLLKHIERAAATAERENRPNPFVDGPVHADQ